MDINRCIDLVSLEYIPIKKIMYPLNLTDEEKVRWFANLKINNKTDIICKCREGE